MLRNYFLPSFFVFLSVFAQAQVILTSSNLPIVIINTDNGTDIPDQPALGATMVIINRANAATNFITDQNTPAYLNYNGRIGIQVRGTTSQGIGKKPYNFETRYANGTNLDTSLLGMPSENDWVLQNAAYDPTFMHDFLAYRLAQDLGNWAAHSVYCEVILNGSYQGLYLLMERIKRDKNRVDVTDLTATQNSLPSLSGGYITKTDRPSGGETVFLTLPGYNNSNVEFVHNFPKPAIISTQQSNYVTTQFNNLQTKASNPSITNGYTTVIDVPSFVDQMLVNEVGSCVDAYELSTFFHKDRNDKLKAGPVWDFNLGFGLDFGSPSPRASATAWQFDNADNTGPKFWKDLYNQPNFRCQMLKRYTELRQPTQPFYKPRIFALIDSIVIKITPAAARDQQKWGSSPNFTGEVTFLKSFLTDRLNWMDNNLTSATACVYPAPPNLVINEIMYHAPDVLTTNGDNYDYIELKNWGSNAINLSGMYFRGGIVYQFANGASIPAGGILVLASNSANYQTKYSLPQPFGIYTREINNDSERIVLADAFGNTIDEVLYFDSLPYPTLADGTGRSIELKSALLDNNLGSSWFTHPNIGGTPNAENGFVNATNDPKTNGNTLLEVRPNPSNGTFWISLTLTKPQTVRLELTTSLGNQVWQSTQTLPQATNEIPFEKQNLAKGVYYLSVKNNENSIIARQKIIIN